MIPWSRGFEGAWAEETEAVVADYRAEDRTLTVSVGGAERFRYAFNKGGAIRGIHDLALAPERNLVGESFQGETTDRVIQWTYWNSSYEGRAHEEGDGDTRANVTMEGCYHEAATCEVLATPASGQVRVLAFRSRIEHWFYKVLDRHGRPRFDTTSIYRVLDDGSLLLTRSVVRHPWQLRDVTVKRRTDGGWEREEVGEVRLAAIDHGPRTFSSYFEGWTPFNRTFLPGQSHAKGAFVEDGYRFWQPEELGGWAMAHSDELAVGVVFGNRQVPENPYGTRLAFNKLDLPNHRLNVLLPAIETSWPDNAVLTQTLVFVVGAPSDVAVRCERRVADVPPPEVRAVD